MELTKLQSIWIMSIKVWHSLLLVHLKYPLITCKTTLGISYIKNSNNHNSNIETKFKFKK